MKKYNIKIIRMEIIDFHWKARNKKEVINIVDDLLNKNNKILNLKEIKPIYKTIYKVKKVRRMKNMKKLNYGKRLFNNTYIANYLNVHKSTISRELRKRRKEKIYIRTGKTKVMPYTAEYAQEDAEFKRGLSKGKYKLCKNK